MSPYTHNTNADDVEKDITNATTLAVHAQKLTPHAHTTTAQIVEKNIPPTANSAT
jgi:hypothetical protein